MDAKSGEVFSIYNPTNGALVSDKIHSASEEDVDLAVDAAQKAFKGAWGKLDPSERAKAMFKFADLVREHAESLARLDTEVMGSAISTQTLGYTTAANLFTYYAGLADKIHGETMYPTSTGPYKIVQREPIGVCAGIGAWNVSSILFAWKVAVSAFIRVIRARQECLLTSDVVSLLSRLSQQGILSFSSRPRNHLWDV